MNRREFLMASTVAGLAASTRFAAAATRIDMYTSSDANVSDFYGNVVKPAFEAANPGLELNVVIARPQAALDAVVQRALAALSTKSDPQLDFIEQYEPTLPAGGIEAGLWTDFGKAGLKSYAAVNKLAIQTPYGLPYRGSQVLIAYDTTKLSKDKVPKTFPDLVAWIKANPGEFIYNRPDKGGSGNNFVNRAVHEVSGRDPLKFTVDNYSQATADEVLGKTWALLGDLAPSLYQGGAYTAGNTASLQLLAQGAVTMIPAWSDQTLQAIAKGVLPETTGLVQLTDLALCGGFSQAVIPTNSAHFEGSLKLADFLLSQEMQTAIIEKLGGFPGVDWSNLPQALHDKYADVIPSSIPTFPAGDWTKAVQDGWYRNVAPNISRT
ncbi:extracellular solute-binding protein [Pleomorphomonas carboxyditropha]|uniref:ABC transporter substrate-binding protein n=1 Tax=Pleomorphomonas carboxyditropha TaxID=2023338 RepID=A0A2G9WQC9_9HYPH|nr:extracellular solute-binding protein [Pleomorphomonas carboxyditropha]PIO96929.1 ABC transporter substrate-binding protein [Pleomorphomonas carboxyditropha]